MDAEDEFAEELSDELLEEDEEMEFLETVEEE